VCLLNNNRVVWQEKNSFHLIDIEQPKTSSWNLVVPQSTTFTQVSFDLGIDSITNVSGAFGGDLDPTKGMYWTWQSGYINFKLEGKASNSSANNNEFQFHLGGYQYPFLACQQVVLEEANLKSLGIKFDLKRALDQTDFTKLHHIMSPSYDAVNFSQLLKESFSIHFK
jgi:hypothetical protein